MNKAGVSEKRGLRTRYSSFLLSELPSWFWYFNLIDYQRGSGSLNLLGTFFSLFSFSVAFTGLLSSNLEG